MSDSPVRDYAHYRPGLTRRILTAGLRLAVHVLLDLEMTGVEHIPASGPVILISNHISFLDPVIVVGLLPRPVIAMSKIENLEDKILGPLVRAFDAFPVRRGQADHQALRASLEVLKAGLPLWIAPEGTRSETGQLQRGLAGLAFIATRSGAPIVPMAFIGTPDFKRNIRRFKRTPVRVIIGAPFYIDRTHSRPRREALTEMTDRAMRRIAALLPPEMRGVYGDQQSGTDEP